MPALKKTDAIPRVGGRVLGDRYRSSLGTGVRSNSRFPTELPIVASQPGSGSLLDTEALPLECLKNRGRCRQQRLHRQPPISFNKDWVA